MATRATKGRADFLQLGSWNAVCDRCGAKFKQEDLRRDWQGFMLCRDDYETRQPQDFVRGIVDPKPIPWARPKVTPVFVSFPEDE
jgi:hypothetical protein